MVAMVGIQTTLFVTEKWLMFPKYFTFPKISLLLATDGVVAF